MDLTESGISDGASGGGAPIIKPEHLSKVISASTADFLIVIGDRNMKNDSCQVRVVADAARRAGARARGRGRDARAANI
jgi:hypothetical protein